MFEFTAQGSLVHQSSAPFISVERVRASFTRYSLLLCTGQMCQNFSSDIIELLIMFSFGAEVFLKWNGLSGVAVFNG